MINRFLFAILCYLTINKLIYYFISRKFVIIENSLDFRKFNFDKISDAKKIIFSKKYFQKKYYD